ncbi:MAG TPA: YndJ family protein [Pyrinomonadaceae bacterium]|nr:YndJ family protein [Pyrinomonadaceae bacterium]
MHTNKSRASFLTKWLRGSAIAGCVVWEAGFFWRSSSLIETELINKILLLGVLVIVPLGLALTPRNKAESEMATFRFAAIAQSIGAALVAGSFLFQQGTIAGLLAAAWLIVTGLTAIHGLARVWKRETRTLEEVSVSAGLLFVLIGAGWLVLSRLGVQPLGFGDTIVLLTAVHFHYAGFAAPILAGLAGRTLMSQPKFAAPKIARRMFGFAVIGIVIGTPIVAAGITLSPRLGFAGTLIISLALILLSIVSMGWVIPQINRKSAQLLLVISALSPFVSMVLASLYSYSLATKRLIIDIPQMAMTHGLVNAFGFALCGLIAWTLLNSERSSG